MKQHDFLLFSKNRNIEDNPFLSGVEPALPWNPWDPSIVLGTVPSTFRVKFRSKCRQLFVLPSFRKNHNNSNFLRTTTIVPWKNFVCFVFPLSFIVFYSSSLLFCHEGVLLPCNYPAYYCYHSPFKPREDCSPSWWIFRDEYLVFYNNSYRRKHIIWPVMILPLRN